MAYITSLGQPVLSSRTCLLWPILDTLQQNDTMKRKAFSSPKGTATSFTAINWDPSPVHTQILKSY